MDGERKYKQRGYHDVGNDNGGSANSAQGRDQKPRQQGPRPPIDITGPRLPRLVQTVTASRCFSCSATLAEGIDFKATCPSCNAALHCCKQCAHFEPSTRFQCLKAVAVRVVVKDQANECEMFSARVTVAREVKQQAGSPGLFHANGALGSDGRQREPRGDDRPRSAQDARAAFDNLFKK